MFTTVSCSTSHPNIVDGKLFGTFCTLSCYILVKTLPIMFRWLYAVVMRQLTHDQLLILVQKWHSINTLRLIHSGQPFYRRHFQIMLLYNSCYILMECHRKRSPLVQSAINLHCFRQLFGDEQAISHYLIQWRLASRRMYASLGLDDIIVKFDFSSNLTINTQYIIHS